MRRQALALPLLLLLGSCASPSAGLEPGERPMRTTLFFAVGVNNDETISSDQQQELEDRIRKLEQGFRVLHPHVRLQLQLFREDQLVEELQRRNHSGLAPDLLLVNGGTARQLIDLRLTRPVRFPEAVTDALDPGALRRVRFGEQDLIGLPVLLQPELACFDRKRLPRSPTTLTELLAASAGGARIGLPIDAFNLAWTFGAFGALGNIAAISKGGPVTAADRQAIRRWLTWLKTADLQQRVSFVASQGQLTHELATGQMDWISCRSTHLPRLKKALGPRLGVAPLPGGPGGAASPISRQRLMVFGVNSSPEQRRAAEAMARFTLNPLMQRTFTLRSHAVLPVNRHVVTPTASSAVLAALVQAHQQSSSADQLSVLVRANDPIQQELDRILLRFLYGELDTTAAANAVIESLRRQPPR